jgi:hypothetical protein
MMFLRTFSRASVCLAASSFFFPSLSAAATVTVVASSYLGGTLTPEIHLFQQGSQKDLWPSIRAKTADNIPPGLYNVEISAFGFRHYHREINVSGEHVEVRAVLMVSTEATGPIRIGGRVLHAKDYVGVWVLLFPLAGDPSNVEEVRVGIAGEFNLFTSNSGPYILAIVRGDDVLHVRRLIVRPENAELIIDAGENK